MMPRLTPVLAALTMTAAGAAFAQTSYPTRPITLIVPHAAGGPTDTVARLVAEAMTQSLGQSLIVENSGGAGSTVGAARVARADPDGYTIMVNNVSQASSGALYRKLAYDPDADFDGIGLMADVPMAVVARSGFEPADVSGYVAYLKTHGDEVLYGHAGVGSAAHLCGMLLMDALGVKITTVPYKGTGPAMTDLLGGTIDTMCDQTTNTLPQIAAGTIRACAVTTPGRLEVLPDLPTLQEAGIPGFEMSVWLGLFAPAGTPAAILETLSGALQTALQDPKVIERFADLGAIPVPIEDATPAAMDAHLAAEIAKWKPIIESAGQFAD